MKITNVSIRMLGDQILQGVASVTFDECFVVHDIKIIQGKYGRIVAMPNKKGADGKHRDVAHPLKKQTRKRIERTVLAEFDRVKEEMGSGGLAEASVTVETAETADTASVV